MRRPHHTVAVPDERPNERRAVRLLEQTTGGQVTLHDTHGRSSAFDYHLDVAGEEPAAVEVTTYTEQEARAAMARWERYAAQGIDLNGLQRWWTVAVTRSTPFKELKHRLAEPLLTLEAQGVHELTPPHGPFLRGNPGLLTAAEELRKLDVQVLRSGLPHDGLAAGHVDVNVGHGATTGLGAEPPLQLLEQFLSDPDKMKDVRGKLADSGASRRHAFIWLDGSSELAAWWLLGNSEFELPDRPPQLPQEITDVWWTAGGRGWRWDSQPNAWSELPPAPADSSLSATLACSC